MHRRMIFLLKKKKTEESNSGTSETEHATGNFLSEKKWIPSLPCNYG